MESTDGLSKFPPQPSTEFRGFKLKSATASSADWDPEWTPIWLCETRIVSAVWCGKRANWGDLAYITWTHQRLWQPSYFIDTKGSTGNDSLIRVTSYRGALPPKTSDLHGCSMWAFPIFAEASGSAPGPRLFLTWEWLVFVISSSIVFTRHLPKSQCATSCSHCLSWQCYQLLHTRFLLFKQARPWG